MERRMRPAVKAAVFGALLFSVLGVGFFLYNPTSVPPPVV